MDFSRDYLEKLAEISTPEWEEGIGYDEKMRLFFSYYQLRIAAKDLLRDTTNKEARDKLSKLIKKLEIDME